MPRSHQTKPTLESSRISERAEAARRLGSQGGPDDLERLLELAVQDVSSGVRLAAAAACADILSRHRLPLRFDAISRERRQAILQRLLGMDPGVNTALFQVMGEIGLPGVGRRIVPGLRDPRVDVRTGAVVGLARLVRAATCNGDRDAEKVLVDAILDPRLRPEIAVELCRIAGRMGLLTALEAVDDLEQRLSGSWVEALDEVRQMLGQARDPEASEGLWVEALPGEPVHEGSRWLVLVPDAVYEGHAGEMAWTDARLEPGMTIDLLHPDGWSQYPIRRILVRAGGRKPRPVLQISIASYRRPDTGELRRWLEALLEERPPAPRRAARLEEAVSRQLAPSAKGAYGRGLLALWCGDAERAAGLLEPGDDPKALPPEAGWFRALALEALNRHEDAMEALGSYLDRASAQSPFLDRARARIGEE